MLKYRIMYAVVVLSAVTMMFVFGHAYLAANLSAIIIVPALIAWCLHFDVRKIDYSIKMSSAYMRGQQAKVMIAYTKKKRLIAAGTLKITLRCRNFMFDTVEFKEIMLPVLGKGQHEYVDLNTNLCGKLEVTVEKAECIDVFGLFSFKLPISQIRIATIYPSYIALRMSEQKAPSGNADGEIYQNRIGTDSNEVFDLRDYVEGDDIRNIHWKLSSKHQKLIMRQQSEPSHNSTVVLYDAGMENNDIKVSNEVLSASVEIAASITEQLLEKGFPHCISFLEHNKLKFIAINERADMDKSLDEWLSVRLPKKCGDGADWFVSYRHEKDFAKLIYITVEMYPEKIKNLASMIDVTIICIKKQGANVNVLKEDSCTIIEIPIQTIYDKTYNLDI